MEPKAYIVEPRDRAQKSDPRPSNPEPRDFYSKAPSTDVPVGSSGLRPKAGNTGAQTDGRAHQLRRIHKPMLLRTRAHRIWLLSWSACLSEAAAAQNWYLEFICQLPGGGAKMSLNLWRCASARLACSRYRRWRRRRTTHRHGHGPCARLSPVVGAIRVHWVDHHIRTKLERGGSRRAARARHFTAAKRICSHSHTAADRALKWASLLPAHPPSWHRAPPRSSFVLM